MSRLFSFMSVSNFVIFNQNDKNMILLRRNVWNEIAYTSSESLGAPCDAFRLTVTNCQTGKSTSADMDNISPNKERYDLSLIAVPFSNDSPNWTVIGSPITDGTIFYDLPSGHYDYHITKTTDAVVLEFGKMIVAEESTEPDTYVAQIQKIAYDPNDGK